MVGRIESYTHGDKTTPNKGIAIVKVTCDSDFGAKTEQFISFSKLVAIRAYASGATSWNDIVEAFPEVEDDRAALSKTLRENIDIESVKILML